MAACCRSTYINYMSACFSHCGNSCLNDITCVIMLHMYISNSPVICDSSGSLPLLLLQNIVKAVEEWGGRASGETWADCLGKSRFEYPPIPSHPPVLPMPFWPILQMPFCVYLLLGFGRQVWSPFQNAASMSSALSVLSAHRSLLQPPHFPCHYSPATTHWSPHLLKSHCQELITTLSICINLIKPACCTNCNVVDWRLIRVTTRTVIT